MKNKLTSSIIIQLILLIIPLSLYSQINLDDGLIAYYPFCENANDESNYENNGIINEATLVEDRFGIMNSAYQFDGEDDYIDCGNNSTLNDSFSELTISSWIYLNQGGEDQQQIIGKWNNTVANDHFTILIDNNKVLFAIANPDNSSNGFLDDKELNYNTWYQIVVTWDNNGMHKVFIDKNLELEVTSNTFNWISTTSNVNLKIGRQINSSQHNRAFNGIIDDLRIYNRVINQMEIDSLYNFNPKETTPIIDIENLKKDIIISPNPASNHVNIQFATRDYSYNLQIFDAQGNRLGTYNDVRNDIFLINTVDFPKGVIFFNISNEKINITKKVVIN